MNRGQARTKADFDVLAKIVAERDKRNWSDYQLAENAGIPASTISTWNRRNIEPGIASIEKVCTGFGLTLAQFFQEDDFGALSPEQRDILDLWFRLSPLQRTTLRNLISAFVEAENATVS